MTVIPLGDIHIGAKACDETRFKETVARIAGDENCYWIGMGDYCDFIQMLDPRFSSGGLAKWLINGDALADLTRAQRDRFLNIIKPIAKQCLGLLEGNHETAITRHYERHIYGEIVTAIKEFAGVKESDPMGLGYNGWLNLKFRRHSGKGKPSGSEIKINLHHGYGGGRLAGAKALNLERRMAFYEADIVIFGHVHKPMIIPGARQRLTGKKVEDRKILGIISGTYLKSFSNDSPATYSEVAGYLPSYGGNVEITLQPHHLDFNQRFRAAIY